MNFRNLTTGIAALCATTLLTSSIAFAQDYEDVDAETVLNNDDFETAVKTKETRDTGWYPKLYIGGTAQIAHNHHVDGVTEGTSFTFGVQILAGIDGVWNFGDSGILTWENKLNIEEQIGKMANLNHWTIPKDDFDFETKLKYGVPSVEWLGPYARFNLHTHLFESSKTFDQDMWIRKFDHGADADKKGSEIKADDINAPLAIDRLAAQDVTKIANPGNPLVLTEAVGIFMDPYKSTPINVSIDVGIAGQHNIVSGEGDSYVNWDTDDDDKLTVDGEELKVYDVIKLIDTNSVGVEASIALSGTVVEILTWEVNGTVYFPFAGDYSKDFEDNAAERIKADLGAKLAINICDWANIAFAFGAKRDPFNYFPKGFGEDAKEKDAWQLNANILLSVGYDLFK